MTVAHMLYLEGSHSIRVVAQVGCRKMLTGKSKTIFCGASFPPALKVGWN